LERGEIYLTAPNPPDLRRRRAFVVVSRPELIASRYSSVVCVPLYTSFVGIPTEVALDEHSGLKRLSYARCDELTSVPRTRLSEFVGRVPAEKLSELGRAMAVALDIQPSDLAD
jgi:mRNA interferase MazF